MLLYKGKVVLRMILLLRQWLSEEFRLYHDQLINIKLSIITEIQFFSDQSFEIFPSVIISHRKPKETAWRLSFEPCINENLISQTPLDRQTAICCYHGSSLSILVSCLCYVLISSAIQVHYIIIAYWKIVTFFA